MSPALLPVLKDHVRRWTPKRRGDIFCSEGCGGNCTWASHQQAQADAKALATQLGKGWQPVVSENLGWHYSTMLDGLTVSPSVMRYLSGRVTIIGYSAALGYFDKEGTRHNLWWASAKTAEAAINAVIGQAEHDVNRRAKTVADATLLLIKAKS